jgi:hypothetical protein
VKRLHDHNRSGWFLATLLIPFANIVFGIWIIVECWFMQGKKGSNRFGPDPLENNTDVKIDTNIDLQSKNSQLGNAPANQVDISLKDKKADMEKTQTNSEPVSQSWYVAGSQSKGISQVVLKIPKSSVVETEFGSIMLPYDNFPIISSNPWCSGLMRMGNHPVPYILIRVGDFAEKVKSCDITIAFSFCKLPSSGMFLMDARIESEEFTTQVRKKYSVVPPLKKPLVEWIVSANDKFSMKMLDEIFSHEKLHIVIAGDSSNMQSTVFMPDGSTLDTVAPSAHHDRIIFLDDSIRKLLRTEYNSLISYNSSIPVLKRDFNDAMFELGKIMPVDKDPVFEKSL